jgi:small conductance mechanosensitive channel
VALTWETVLFAVLAIVAIAAAGEGLYILLARVLRIAQASDAAIRRTHTIVRAVWIGLAAIAVLTIAGVTTDLLAVAVVTILGLVISLSLQTTFSNMISGAFLLYDGAIRVGDHIEHFAAKGVVVRVALRNTWVRTEGGQITVIGNAKLADGPLMNYELAARFDASQGIAPRGAGTPASPSPATGAPPPARP